MKYVYSSSTVASMQERSNRSNLQTTAAAK